MDEKQLMRDAESNYETFAELYRKNVTRVYRYHMVHVGNANVAEDLTTQTFMAAIKELPSFRQRGSFAIRVLEIAVQKCLKDRRWSRRELPNDAVLYYQVSSLPGDKTAMRRMEIESVSRALKQISPDRAEAIILHFFGDLTKSEISVMLKKRTDTIEALISGGLEEICACTSLSSAMKSMNSSLEDNTLIDKLSIVAAQIEPDPVFEYALEQTLAANHQPKTNWILPLQKFSKIMGWLALIGLTFFLINSRVAPNTPIPDQATTHPSTQVVKKAVTITVTSTPTLHRPTARPTATDIPLQKYTVQAGDTCTYIANKFGVSIDLLITLNHLNSACDIWADQQLMIPVTPISTASN
jgi:RNA polymerase sigma-70 factor, ECF subfamily